MKSKCLLCCSSSTNCDETNVSLCSYNLLRIGNSENTFYVTNVPRNVASLEVQSYNAFMSVIWNGGVCQGTFNETCLDSQRTRIPAGVYRLRFSALKHFGNVENSADFEVYRTPSFNLVY